MITLEQANHIIDRHFRARPRIGLSSAQRHRGRARRQGQSVSKRRRLGDDAFRDGVR